MKNVFRNPWIREAVATVFTSAAPPSSHPQRRPGCGLPPAPQPWAGRDLSKNGDIHRQGKTVRRFSIKSLVPNFDIFLLIMKSIE